MAIELIYRGANSGGAVKSVNGKVGEVILTAEDVGATTKDYVDSAIENIDIPEVDLTNYALKTEIPSTSGLATKDYVDTAINGIEIPETDLTGYATEKYVNDAIGNVSVTDEQVSSAVNSWLNENPEATTTVADGSINKLKLSDSLIEEIGLDGVHRYTVVELETMRCNWDGTANSSGSYTLIKPFKTPTYIALSLKLTPHRNVSLVFASTEDFATDAKAPFDGIFWRSYKANELEPMFMENVPGYEYCRMLFQTSSAFTATAYYDSYKQPISTEETKAEIGLFKGDGRTYACAVVPYKPCKFYLAKESQINGGQSLTDVYGTSDDNIFADEIKSALAFGGSYSGNISNHIQLTKMGVYADSTSNENYKMFDASGCVDYRPKYLVFPLVRHDSISATTREEGIAQFRANPTYTIRGGLSDTLPIKINNFYNPVIENPIKKAHWLLMGDSITDWFAGKDYSGEGFASKIALEFDMTFDNIGYEGENLNGGITRFNDYVQKVEAGTKQAPDYITIAYGTNGTANTIGTVDDSEDAATYPGWTKKIISLIREKFPYAMIGFVLPMQGDWITWNPSAAGKDIKGNHDAIKGVLELPEYAVPYIDMYYESGIIPTMLPNEKYPNDTIHPRSEIAQNKYYHAMRRFMMGL